MLSKDRKISQVDNCVVKANVYEVPGNVKAKILIPMLTDQAKDLVNRMQGCQVLGPASASTLKAQKTGLGLGLGLDGNGLGLGIGLETLQPRPRVIQPRGLV